MVLALPFHFLDRHGVVGFSTCFLIYGQVSDDCGLEQMLLKAWNNLG